MEIEYDDDSAPQLSAPQRPVVFVPSPPMSGAPGSILSFVRRVEPASHPTPVSAQQLASFPVCAPQLNLPLTAHCRGLVLQSTPSLERNMTSGCTGYAHVVINSDLSSLLPGEYCSEQQSVRFLDPPLIQQRVRSVGARGTGGDARRRDASQGFSTADEEPVGGEGACQICVCVPFILG